MQWLLFPCCRDFLGRIIYDMALDGYLDAVTFGIENHTFIIPIAGGSGLPYHLDSVTGHLLGKVIHFFFGTDGKRKMRIPEII